jgi:hypothetical protein
MNKRSVLHVFGAIGLLVIGDFWVRYYRFCRFNAVAPFNKFIRDYNFEHLIILMTIAAVAGGIAAISNKLWILTSVLALGTLFFAFSQIT